MAHLRINSIVFEKGTASSQPAVVVKFNYRGKSYRCTDVIDEFENDLATRSLLGDPAEDYDRLAIFEKGAINQADLPRHLKRYLKQATLGFYDCLRKID